MRHDRPSPRAKRPRLSGAALLARGCASLLLLASASAARLGAQAQGPAPNTSSTPRTPEVQVDRNSAAIGGVLPFDEPLVLTGVAGPTLLRLDVWYADSTKLSRAACEKLTDADTLVESRDAKTRKVTAQGFPRGRWQRIAPAATTFWVPMRALRPNRPYTICFHSVESLSAADSTAFVARAVTALRKVVRDKVLGFDPVRIEADSLRRVHTILRDALRSVVPPGDSVAVPAGSVLAAPPTAAALATPEGAAARLKLDTLLYATLVGLVQVEGDRLSLAEEMEARASSMASPPTNPTPLGWRLREVSRQAAMRALAGAIRALDSLPKPEAQRLSASAELARRLSAAGSGITGIQAEALASGMTTLSDPRFPSAGISNLGDRRDTVLLASWSANLDSTAARLADLRALVAFAISDSAAARSVSAHPDSLVRLDSMLRETMQQLAVQRHRLGLLIAAVTESDAGVQRLAAKLAGRDVTRLGVFSSTSASYEARARWYVGQDLGVIFARRGADVRQVSPYVGLSLYFRPVNKRAPKPVFCLADARCTSLNVGVPTSNWEDTDRYTGILGGRPLVLGVGTRVGDFFRVSLNAPLVYRYTFREGGERRRGLSAIPAVAAALDADLRDIISGLANAIFPK